MAAYALKIQHHLFGSKLQGRIPLVSRRSHQFSEEYDGPAWSPADLRDANGGLNDREFDLLDCPAVASNVQLHSKLLSLGIRRTADLYFEAIVFLQNGRFEFASDVWDASGVVVAVVFPAPDEIGQTIDLAAWEPETRRLALLQGRVSMLGQGNLYGWRVGEPLAMHESPLDWLKADRNGVFVIDPQRASPLLRMVEPLGVSRASFGRRMQEAMTIRPPRIVVAESWRAA